MIFAWNEFFLAVQLNPVDGSTVPVWVTHERDHARQLHGQALGGFDARGAAVVIAGWIAQKRMIRGLSMGAIK